MRTRASAVVLVLLGTLLAACSGGTDNSSRSVSGKLAGTSPAALHLTAAQRRALAERYLAIAQPANAQLEVAVDGFREHQRKSLEAAAADLKGQASIERRFDRELLAIEFPAQVEQIAAKLVQANEVRADLALAAATSTTLAALATFDSVRSASDASVEQQVSALRRQIGLPPPDTD